MQDVLDIGEVARRTGLTLRGLRFYEARGLVTPLRTHSGRRIYGAGELARLNAVVALKRAGFSLAQIGAMLGRGRVDLGRLVAAQLEALDARAAEIAESRALLRSVQSRIDQGEQVDVATLCSLIAKGNIEMEQDRWKQVVDLYYTPEQQAEWQQYWAKTGTGFDPEAYHASWRALSDKVEAALPLDPASDAAQALVDEWFALLKPFSDLATPEMWNGTRDMYDRMEEWEGQADPGFSSKVWEFIRAATRARLDAGGKIDAPAWMLGAKG
jgi:MerR family transcriptional regulator, thiopeptide resistance regulator